MTLFEWLFESSIFFINIFSYVSLGAVIGIVIRWLLIRFVFKTKSKSVRIVNDDLQKLKSKIVGADTSVNAKEEDTISHSVDADDGRDWNVQTLSQSDDKSNVEHGVDSLDEVEVEEKGKRFKHGMAVYIVPEMFCEKCGETTTVLSSSASAKKYWSCLCSTQESK